MKILLVEDDRDLCNTVKLQLERAGYETDVCYQGQDALFYANQYPYDVIVLDRMLPQVDGLTILQGLRRKQIATPVIITTALDGVNDRIDGLDAGADDYLVKPFAFEELLARLRVLLRKPVTEKSSTPWASCWPASGRSPAGRGISTPERKNALPTSAWTRTGGSCPAPEAPCGSASGKPPSWNI